MRSCVVELGRRLHAEHDGEVRDLEASLREQGRERRLGGATHADQHEVRLLEVARLLAVVALDGELHRLDAPEVLLREGEHGARHVDGLPVEEGGELHDERADEIERLDLQLVARGVDVLAQLGAHHGEDDERPLLGCALEDRAGRFLGAHPGMEPDVRSRVRELQHGGTHDLLRRLPRRVTEDVDATCFASQTVYSSQTCSVRAPDEGVHTVGVTLPRIGLDEHFFSLGFSPDPEG
jgi:hypothetical protein